MKAFKGCTNTECRAYHKIHYKNDDEFCLKCGAPLSYVCADCWKVMPDEKKRLCTSCAAAREQKREQNWDKTKKVAGGAVAAVSAAAVAVVKLGKDTDKIVDGVKKIADTGADVVRFLRNKRL